MTGARIISFPVRKRLAAIASQRSLDALIGPARLSSDGFRELAQKMAERLSATKAAYSLQLEEGRVRLICDATLEPWDARRLARELLKLADESEGR